MTFSKCTECAQKKYSINFLRSSDEMWTASWFDGHLCFLPKNGERKKERKRERERERERERGDVPLILPHFYCRKSGSTNALVTRRFPVTCCPGSMSPRVSLPRPRERNPCQQDPVVRSSWSRFRSPPPFSLSLTIS